MYDFKKYADHETIVLSLCFPNEGKVTMSFIKTRLYIFSLIDILKHVRNQGKKIVKQVPKLF